MPTAIWPLEVYQSQFQRAFPTWTWFDTPKEMPLVNNGKTYFWETIVILIWCWIDIYWLMRTDTVYMIYPCSSWTKHRKVWCCGVIILWHCIKSLWSEWNGFHLNNIKETPDLTKLIFHIDGYQTVCFYCCIKFSNNVSTQKWKEWIYICMPSQIHLAYNQLECVESEVNSMFVKYSINYWSDI